MKEKVGRQQFNDPGKSGKCNKRILSQGADGACLAGGRSGNQGAEICRDCRLSRRGKPTFLRLAHSLDALTGGSMLVDGYDTGFGNKKSLQTTILHSFVAPWWNSVLLYDKIRIGFQEQCMADTEYRITESGNSGEMFEQSRRYYMALLGAMNE